MGEEGLRVGVRMVVIGRGSSLYAHLPAIFRERRGGCGKFDLRARKTSREPGGATRTESQCQTLATPFSSLSLPLDPSPLSATTISSIHDPHLQQHSPSHSIASAPSDITAWFHINPHITHSSQHPHHFRPRCHI